MGAVMWPEVQCEQEVGYQRTQVSSAPLEKINAIDFGGFLLPAGKC